MPFTTRRLPQTQYIEALPPYAPPRQNLLAFVSLTLGLVVPAGIFLAGLAGLFVGFRLDFWPGFFAVAIATLTSIGAITIGISAVHRAGGSREPAARRGMALLGLGLGYLDVVALVAFIVWTLIRAIQGIHLGG